MVMYPSMGSWYILLNVSHKAGMFMAPGVADWVLATLLMR